MAATQTPADSRAVRERLVEALRLDLVGPWAGHELDAEHLPGRERPSNWYVAGFLIPTGTPPERSADADEDDDLDTVPESAGLAEESNDERKAARKAFFPSSIGLSFLVGAARRELAVTARWGDYAPAEIEEAGGGKMSVWRRTPHEAVLAVPLGGDAEPAVRDVPGSGGLQLHVVERPIGAMGTDGAELPAGTRSASCFLVNRRTPDEVQPDCAYAFQAEIAGPLGTMAGLYETAIEALAVREVDGQVVKPKIVASTATVRRAQDQIQALFARGLTQVFPPPGPNRRDTFFARAVPSSETPARRYVGIASQGRNPKVLMRRVLLALMGAAQQAWHEAGGGGNPRNPADPYMTALAYFNSLRELGGARRILEEEVRTTVARYGARRRVGEARRLFRDRTDFSEPVELTSRVSTDQVAEARRRLECRFDDRRNRVDCALATNMISVGLDIPRLGLMLVLGQPKVHAEYIQATSRVGRSDKGPGLVVTLLNVHKPRDRSHYERFRHYHETFYRSVEAGGVTPFSPRALDRGFAGALVALARHLEPALTPARGVERIGDVRAALEPRLLAAFEGRVAQQAFAEDTEREERMRSVQDRVGDLLDSWRRVFDDYHGDGVELQYQRYELKQPKLKPLLREMLDERFETEHHRKFRANRSLRDVEPEVNLYLHDLRAPRPTEGT